MIRGIGYPKGKDTPRRCLFWAETAVLRFAIIVLQTSQTGLA
ncbi:hypothetical protein HMPREF0281_02595 [Corynebacterium ammoniagenes DSM 20306]|uniref:Uncharacterized protein n=1 Tax=Corynebacterium ammoniagenes DSM 20306 TaxID=649754 RepID=A0ABN0ACR4_CORAM|nr:hypothetical protein HMPREF0281_02595 [Corynebacterium ammoniagenes DSM 20306]